MSTPSSAFRATGSTASCTQREQPIEGRGHVVDCQYVTVPDGPVASPSGASLRSVTPSSLGSRPRGTLRAREGAPRPGSGSRLDAQQLCVPALRRWDIVYEELERG